MTVRTLGELRDAVQRLIDEYGESVTVGVYERDDSGIPTSRLVENAGISAIAIDHRANIVGHINQDYEPRPGEQRAVVIV